MSAAYSHKIDMLMRAYEQAARLRGADVELDMSWLTDRADLNGFPPPSHISPNGSCRLIKARDGWIAVNLAREEDLLALPAWIGCENDAEPWNAIEQAALHEDVVALVDRGQLLEIPVAPAYRGRPSDIQFRKEAVRRTRLTPGLCRVQKTPLIIDLSSLWAGPLCGQLLLRTGARVVKVESSTRPDGARFGSSRFFEDMNNGKEVLLLDLTSEQGRAELRELILRADVVIESSRPRALQQLGFDCIDFFSRNPFLTWVSITAYGREGPWSNHVGFGDDAAAAGGLLSWSADDVPSFIGDAIADPLTGIAAATASLRALSEGGGVLLDASLREVAASVASI